MNANQLSPNQESKLIIRHATDRDLSDLEWGGEYKHFRRLYRETYQSTLEGKTLMWVAYLPERGLVGQVFVQLQSARYELADGFDRAYVYGFRVRTAYRNVGIGTRLLGFLEADLFRRKYRWVTLNVGKDNRAARRFYERNGYRVVASEPGEWYYLDHEGNRHDVHEPAWRMEKWIG